MSDDIHKKYEQRPGPSGARYLWAINRLHEADGSKTQECVVAEAFQDVIAYIRDEFQDLGKEILSVHQVAPITIELGKLGKEASRRATGKPRSEYDKIYDELYDDLLNSAATMKEIAYKANVETLDIHGITSYSRTPDPTVLRSIALALGRVDLAGRCDELMGEYASAGPSEKEPADGPGESLRQKTKALAGERKAEVDRSSPYNQRLAKVMKEQGLGSYAVADKSGLKRTVILDIAGGGEPTEHVARKLSEALDSDLLVPDRPADKEITRDSPYDQRLMEVLHRKEITIEELSKLSDVPVGVIRVLMEGKCVDTASSWAIYQALEYHSLLRPRY